MAEARGQLTDRQKALLGIRTNREEEIGLRIKPSADIQVKPAEAARSERKDGQWDEFFQRGFTDRLVPATGVGGGDDAGARQARAGKVRPEEYLARAQALTRNKTGREMIQQYEPELGKPEMQAVLAAEKSLRGSMERYGWKGAAVSRRGEAYDFDLREKPGNLVGLARMIELVKRATPQGSPLADATPRELAGMARKLMLTYLFGRGQDVAGNRPIFSGKKPKEWQDDQSWSVAMAVTNRDVHGDQRIPFSDFLQSAKEILIAESRKDHAGEQALVQRFLDLAENGEIRKFDKRKREIVVEHAPVIVDNQQGEIKFTLMEALNAIAQGEHQHPSFQVEWMLDQPPQKQ